VQNLHQHRFRLQLAGRRFLWLRLQCSAFEVIESRHIVEWVYVAADALDVHEGLEGPDDLTLLDRGEAWRHLAVPLLVGKHLKVVY
jgi:hypothetical protein